ncbi:MAG: DUF3592 domain-containing protein, partial [Burkholderiales bacterium]|nr:DUF3592 domain-containing protein [Burkholderiales bacterium]
QYTLLGVGALAALAGVLILIQRVRTIFQGRVAEGVVVGAKKSVHSIDRGKTHYVSHAVYEFTHDGKTFRCESSFGDKAGIREGTRVRVRYLPSDPQGTAEIDSIPAMWGFPVVGLVVGAIFIAFALYDAGYLGR